MHICGSVLVCFNSQNALQFKNLTKTLLPNQSQHFFPTYVLNLHAPTSVANTIDSNTVYFMHI